MLDRLNALAMHLVPTALPEPWQTFVGLPLRIAIIVIGAALIRFVAHRLINRYVRTANKRHEDRLKVLGSVGGVLANATGYGSARHDQRTATAATIVKSTVTFVVAGTALLMILELLGIPLAPLLASAGVGGLAIGFGAQSLVKDTLSGLFMIVEDQYGVGDVIDTGSVVGTVDEVTLRITRMRDGDGVVWYIRNGEILRLGNRSQGWSVAAVDVQLGYTEDISRVTRILTEAVTHLGHEEPWSDVLMEAPAVTGIESMMQGLVTLRVTAKVKANERDGVQRELRTRIKAALDANDVKMPAPGPFLGPAV
ncbi:MAG: mechanosensitive ion channel family protein [Lapillicoccus sp.]